MEGAENFLGAAMECLCGPLKAVTTATKKAKTIVKAVTVETFKHQALC